jgi:hypothetical protein
MFERFRIGFTAARDCWAVLRQDMKLLLLPVMSGVACLAVVVSFAVPLAVLRPDELHGMLENHRAVRNFQAPAWFWGVLFAFYFCNYFVIYFFNAALIHCALFRFRGMEIGVSDGLRAAWRRLPLLVAWALVSATVRLVSWLLGTTWSILTYFVVPVLVVERVGPFRAIKRSAEILRDTWGEAVGGRLGIGWFLLPFWLLGLGLMGLGIFIVAAHQVVGLIILGVTVAYLVVLGLVNSALETIMLGGLYLYATQGEIPEEMDRATLEQAFAVE